MAAGQLLDGQYEVLSVISEGTHSHIYRAKEKLTGLSCSVKVLKSGEGKDALLRFQDEAKLLRRLDHPVVLRFQTFGATASGEPYIVVEDAQGRSLETVLNECKRFSVEKALKLFHQICDGMGIAHHLGIYHRNLKPSKIIVVDESNSDITIKILDFGVAGVLRSDYNHIANLTKPGSTVPSPHYMSPEQCMARQTDGRADIYAFGCIMYRTLTGHKPFAGKTAIEVLAKHINETPPGFKQVAPELNISPELEKIVFRCLEKSPEDRFASVSELRRALENFKDKGTAGAAVSHVTIPGAAEPSKQSAKEPARPKEKSPPPKVEQTAPEPSPPTSDSALNEPGSGTDTGRMRPRPTKTELNTKKHNPAPILILALLLAVGAAAVVMMRPAPTGPDTQTTPATAITLAEAGGLSPPAFLARVDEKLPESIKEYLENEDSFVSQDSNAVEWVMKQRVKPAISKTDATFGSESLESAWMKQRLADLLLINEYFPEAETLSGQSLELQTTKFEGKPRWMADRTRSGLIVECLAEGKLKRATDEMILLCNGNDVKTAGDDSFKTALEQLETNASELSLLVTSSQLPDSVVEEKLRTILSSSGTARAGKFELKSYILWYLLMLGLNKNDNDKAVNEVLSQFQEATASVRNADNVFGYMLYLASQKARKAGLANIARAIDEEAVKRLKFGDEKDPLYLDYKRHYSTGLPGLTLSQPVKGSDNK